MNDDSNPPDHYTVIHVPISLHVTGSEHATCSRRTYEKIYCFKRNPTYFGVKFFTTLVMTDRDWDAPQYGGQEIDWENWNDYMHGYGPLL